MKWIPFIEMLQLNSIWSMCLPIIVSLHSSKPACHRCPSQTHTFISISVALSLSVFVTCALTMSTYTCASALGGQTDISVTTKMEGEEGVEREEVEQRRMVEKASAKSFFIETSYMLITLYNTYDINVHYTFKCKLQFFCFSSKKKKTGFRE